MRVEYVKREAAKSQYTNKKDLIFSRFVSYVVLFLLSVVVVYPFVMMVISSLTEGGSYMVGQDGALFSFQGYVKIFTSSVAVDPNTEVPYLVTGIKNTLLITLPSTLFGLFVSAFSAYAFAKIKFKGRNTLFFIMLMTMMIPGALLFVPSFIIYSRLNLVNTFFPLIIPGCFGSAMCVFFLRQAFMAIPDDYIEAAKLDGIGHFRIFWKIVVPLSAPALISQGLLGFVGGYNDYLGPLLYLQDSRKYTLQIALQLLYTQTVNSGDNQLFLAGTVVSLLPTIIIFLFAQKYFVKGITNSGIK